MTKWPQANKALVPPTLILPFSGGRIENQIGKSVSSIVKLNPLTINQLYVQVGQLTVLNFLQKRQEDKLSKPD